MQKKLVMIFMGIILAFVVLIGRITYINASKGSRYTKIVLEQQAYNSRTIPFKRGDIVDRNGTKIATSERVYKVILDVHVMTYKEEYIEPTIEVLKSCFEIPEEDIRTVVKENSDSRYEILKTGVTYEKAQEFRAIEEDKEKYPKVKGIWLEEDYKRSYPYNTLASDVIGFTAGGNNGNAGIESAYNDVLNGTDGREYGYFADDSSLERTVKASKNGNTVVSTIDITLQSIVEQCILEFNETHKGQTRTDEPGSKNTAVMIMNPNTGEILAEASYPNFDLNKPREVPVIYKKAENGWEYTPYLYSEELWKTLSEEDKVESMSNLWRNFCVSDAFEPGSTMKPFTVSAGLETGALSGEETYVCGGFKHVGDNDIHCHLRTGHGVVTVPDAIAYSCNVALMDMAAAIGVENFIRYQHIFGFGEYTGIDLPGEASTSPLLFTTENMQPVDLASNSFGQNFNVTMTQLAAAFSSLVNGGNYYEPHVVKQIQDEDGKVIETKDPVLLHKTVSEETSVKIRQYMKGTMEYGTGKPAAVPGYDIGAKTGTAEKLPRENGKYLLSYIGYAPQDNPEVVVYVVIDEPNVPDQSTSAYVLELAQKIMAQAFPYLNVTMIEGYQPEPTPEPVQQETSTEYVDFAEGYEDTYSNVDGAYVDESYTPDFDDWATGESTE